MLKNWWWKSALGGSLALTTLIGCESGAVLSTGQEDVHVSVSAKAGPPAVEVHPFFFLAPGVTPLPDIQYQVVSVRPKTLSVCGRTTLYQVTMKSEAGRPDLVFQSDTWLSPDSRFAIIEAVVQDPITCDDGWTVHSPLECIDPPQSDPLDDIPGCPSEPGTTVIRRPPPPFR
jgi:hypothetical protein